MNNMCTFWWSESLRWGGRPMSWRLQLNPSPINRKSTIIKWKNRCLHSMRAAGFGGSWIEECLILKLYSESSKAENKKCGWNKIHTFFQWRYYFENWNDDWVFLVLTYWPIRINIKTERYSPELASFIVTIEGKKTRATMLSILNLNESNFLHPKDSNGAIMSYGHNFLFQKIPINDDTYDNEHDNIGNIIFHGNPCKVI